MAETPSLLQQQVLERTVIVVFVTGMTDGGPQYAYVAVPAGKAADFAAALASPPCPLHEWGTILASGSGMPDPETRAYMESHYGAIHDGAGILERIGGG